MRYRVLQEKMKENDICAALLSYHRDLFYYANTGQPCNLLIPGEGEPTLFVRRALDFVRSETHLSDIVPAAGLDAAVKKLKEKYPRGGKLGVAEEVIPARLYRRIKEAFSDFSLVNISPLVLQQRAVKEPGELELMRGAARLFEEAHRAVMENMKPGAREIEVSAEIYRCLRRAGGEPVNFHRRWDAISSHEGYLAGSKTSWQISGMAMTVTGKGTGPCLPWGASPEKLENGDVVVLDIGINYRGYHADISRTYVLGRANGKTKERYRAVQEIMEAALEQVRPGKEAQEIYYAALEKARQLKVDRYFQGWGEMQGNYIGHGIGIELDEPPVLMEGIKDPLKENMAVCIEPKLIVPEWGAVDREETLVVKNGPPEILSPVSGDLWETGQL